jgi:hypothetical protein
MNKQHFPLTVAGRQPGQELDATLPYGGILDRGFKQAPRPDDALLGTGSKPIRMEQDALVVVPEQHDRHTHGEIETLNGVGAVARCVPKVVDAGNVLLGRVGEYSSKGLQVAVSIAENRLHRYALL